MGPCSYHGASLHGLGKIAYAPISASCSAQHLSKIITIEELYAEGITGNEFLFQPRRSRALGAPPSTRQTLPSPVQAGDQSAGVLVVAEALVGAALGEGSAAGS